MINNKKELIEIDQRHAKCKIQNAKFKIQKAKGKRQNAKRALTYSCTYLPVQSLESVARIKMTVLRLKAKGIYFICFFNDDDDDDNDDNNGDAD